MKKSILNDKELEIKIDEPKLIQPIFGKNYLEYRVRTQPFNWIVYRSYNDFENLRKLITKFFPEFYIPFLKSTNKSIEKELINKKQMKFLNLFIKELVQNQSFRTSEVLLAFLSYEDKNNFENVIKEYSKKQPQNSKVEEYETIDGKAKISNLEENEKYIKDITKYFDLNSQIFERINSGLKQYNKNMSKVNENLNDIHKNFDLLFALNTKKMVKPAITKSFEELSIFFSNYAKITLKMKDLIKYHFKDFFKNIHLENKAFTELINRREKLKEKYVTEKAYENPKFVEDVLRDIICMLKDNEKITFYEVEVEAQESIHNHNAWAWQSETK